MTGLIMKVIMCPLTLIISDLLFPQVDYRNYYQAVIVGLMLAFAAHFIELLILKRGTVWFSLAVDVLTATLLVYSISNLFYGARITFTGAVYAAILIGTTEYVQHIYLTHSGKTKKHS
ncbi:MAG TPA: DUF2512 family protein [Candidatus Nitrosocosmicus sp.]|nr:DUF2512 family protein [Candidatus Nitrosocosmicus sp.]